MNLFVIILIIFIVCVIGLWLFWKFDKEDEPEKEELKKEIEEEKPSVINTEITKTNTLIKQIEQSNKEFMDSLHSKKEPTENKTEPIVMPEFENLTMFTKNQKPAPKQTNNAPSFTGFDRKKLGMLQDSEMIQADGSRGMMTKNKYSIEKNKIEPRLTLALRMDPTLIDSWKSAHQGPTVDQGQKVLKEIEAKTGTKLKK